MAGTVSDRIDSKPKEVDISAIPLRSSADHLDAKLEDVDISAVPLHSLADYTSPRETPITVTTGWDRSLLFSLILCLVATAWGVVLAIFSSGIIAVRWSLSSWGQSHLSLINVFVTAIATISTAQLKMTIQSVATILAETLLINGFTLRSLSLIQGVNEWRLSTPFPKRWRLAWLVAYVVMAVHSASVVAILQPFIFVRHIFFGDLVPCGVPQDRLTLNPTTLLSPQDIAELDNSAYLVGLQLGSYREQIAWNVTTVAFGRPYVKENVSFAAVGGLINGLQNVSGVLFDVQCTENPTDIDAVRTIWSRALPTTPFPTPITTRINDTSVSGSFPELALNTTLTQSIASSRIFNLTSEDMALYTLASANGSGALIGVTVQGVIGCSWLAIPKHVEVITVNWISRSLQLQDESIFPEYVGRGVVATLGGMAEASRLGARLDRPRANIAHINANPHPDFPGTRQTLAILLADGVKAALTGFHSVLARSDSRRCQTNNRTIASHWRFGNAHRLGWFAIVLTPGVGIAGVVILGWVSRRRRARDVMPLDVGEAFLLGLRCDVLMVSSGKLLDAPLEVEGDRVVAKSI